MKAPYRVRKAHEFVFHCPYCDSDVDFFGHYKVATPYDLDNLTKDLVVVNERLVAMHKATVTCPHCGRFFNPCTIPAYVDHANWFTCGHYAYPHLPLEQDPAKSTSLFKRVETFEYRGTICYLYEKPDGKWYNGVDGGPSESDCDFVTKNAAKADIQKFVDLCEGEV